MAGIVIFLGAQTTLAEVNSDFATQSILPIENSCPQPIKTIPLAKTLVATLVSSTTAELAGMVNPNNGPTKYWFEYGITQNLSQGTGFVYVGNNNENTNVLIKIENLNPNTTYYYRIVAENNIDAANGEIATLKTNNN